MGDGYCVYHHEKGKSRSAETAIHNFGNTGNTLRSCAIGAKENFASSYASALKKAETDLEKLLDQYRSITE